MGDSKEISKSLIEEGDVYQKVDLAFKVQIKNTHFSFILLFLVPFRITLRSCFYPKGEKSLSIKHQRSLANKQPSPVEIIDCCALYSLTLDFIILIQTSISVSTVGKLSNIKSFNFTQKIILSGKFGQKI